MISDELFHSLKPLIYFHRIFGCFYTKPDSKLLIFWKAFTFFCLHLVVFLILLINAFISFKSVKTVTVFQTTELVAYMYQITLFLLLTFEIMVCKRKYEQILEDMEELVWKFQNDYNIQVRFASLRMHSWLLLCIIIVPIIVSFISYFIMVQPKIEPSHSHLPLKKLTVLGYLYFQILMGFGLNIIVVWLLIFLELSKVLERLRFQSNFVHNFSEIYESLHHLYDKLIKCFSFLTSVMMCSLSLRIVIATFLYFNLERMTISFRSNAVSGKY